MNKRRVPIRRQPKEPVNPQHLHELERRDRNRAVARTVVTITLTWLLLGGIYFALPGAGQSGFREVARLTVSLGLVGAVFASQTRKVANAAMPQLRAIEALGIVLPLFLLVFSIVYLSISNGSPAAFTQRLDHTAALYFTITVFATVGFGDIAAVSGTARLIVSMQMLLDLAILGVVVRIIFGTARSALDRRRSD